MPHVLAIIVGVCAFLILVAVQIVRDLLEKKEAEKHNQRWYFKSFAYYFKLAVLDIAAGVLVTLITNVAITNLLSGDPQTKSVELTPQPFTSLSEPVIEETTALYPQTDSVLITPMPTSDEYYQWLNTRSLTYINFTRTAFAGNQKLEVYSAPSFSSWHGLTSKQEVVFASTNGDVYVAGYTNGWTLIRYYIGSNDEQGSLRMGYTPGTYGSPLYLDSYTGTIIKDCNLTDGTDYYASLRAGTTVTILGRMDNGIHIETTSDDGRVARGLIPEECVGDIR